MKPGIITELPGPKSQELLKLKEQIRCPRLRERLLYVCGPRRRSVSAGLDGNVFVDFAGGIGILNAGHCPPEVVEVLKTQIDHYLHTGHIFLMEPLVRLAERLAQIAPGILLKR